ncbi:Putative phosphoserine phosphatase 2 [Vibrio aerogenes CECT 7868]|uniref:Putative phosphoserine phosphatase 2 n=1 Tax=Vibrio aerogenes CECT 7868 TaxID=1216006 RepID=A0A1M6AAU0_9VIBR|nr:histidine phosphatase family protein [Vibrio aerogenes]SHI33595.1 Putative phosphoserine phosphatase 2 [Vibrio aerogenes CECT 7868]
MKLILVRHGQTQWNRQRRIQGWQDSPLTQDAIAQLRKLKLPESRQPVIYSSDLGRAHQSALILAEPYGVEVLTDSRLRERKFGVLEGRVIDEDEALSDCWQAYHHRYQAPMNAVPGVESERDFEQRIRSFLADLASICPQEPEQCIVIVSHGEWIRACRNLIHGIPSWHQGRGVEGNGVVVALPTGAVVSVPSASSSIDGIQIPNRIVNNQACRHQK